jgi:hypothetical protein
VPVTPRYLSKIDSFIGDARYRIMKMFATLAIKVIRSLCRLSLNIHMGMAGMDSNGHQKIIKAKLCMLTLIIDFQLIIQKSTL